MRSVGAVLLFSLLVTAPSAHGVIRRCVTDLMMKGETPSFEEFRNLSSIRAQTHKKFARKLLKAAEAAMPDLQGSEFDDYPRRSKPNASYTLFFDNEGNLTGGQVSFSIRALDTDQDVSWSWTFKMQATGDARPVFEGYWDWSGH